MSPRISVLMGVYNREKTVGRAIDSILKQTFEDFEFIICDDASTDGSLKVLYEYAKKDKRIKVLHNGQNIGLAGTLNKCLAYAKGEYVARMDDDDVSQEGRFEKQVSFLDTHTEYVLLGTGRKIFDKQGVWGIESVECEPSVLEVFLRGGFTHPTVMIRRNPLIEVGGYTSLPRTQRCEDFDLWCKLYERGYKGYVIGDVLLEYFEDRNVVSHNTFKKRFGCFITVLLHRRLLHLPWFYDYRAFQSIGRLFIPKFIVTRHKLKSRGGILETKDAVENIR